MKRIWKRTFNILALLMLVASILAVNPHPVKAAAVIRVTAIEGLVDGNNNPIPSDQNGTYTSLCSLREAIRSANENKAIGGCAAGTAGADTIILPAGYVKLTLTGTDAAGVYDASKGDLDITEDLTIAGAGFGSSDVDSTLVYGTPGWNDRIFEVHSPTSTPINVRFSNLRIKGGAVTSNPGGGGILIDNDANVTVDRVYVTENLLSSTITGGGVANYGSIKTKLTVTNSTFDTNSSSTGGGIYNLGTLEVERSLFIGNTGSTSGGGIDNAGHGVATITSSTFVSNTSISSTGGGAGVSNSSIMTLQNVTIVNNTGTNVLQDGSSTTSVLTINNSILSQSTTSSYANCSRRNEDSTFVTGGYNIIYGGSDIPSGQTPCTWGSNDKPNVDPLLSSSLQESPNSPTRTFEFTSTASPAIDIVPLSASCVGYDQRGYSRPVDGNGGTSATDTNGCDAGAYEAGSSYFLMYLSSIRR